MNRRDAVFPAGRQALYERDRYSAAIRSGDLLFVSGQVGSREDGSPEPDFRKQVGLAFDNLAAVLRAAGCGFGDVVDVTSFHTDPAAQFETVQEVRMAAIGDPPYPNWTAVGVTWLSGFDFEIKVVARIPAAR
jgi:enamine deaminase RidA (YjgF/YER057c/UK114 family)